MKATSNINTLWQQRIDAWRDSGLKQSVWCRQNDVKASQFWYWNKKLSSISEQSLQKERDDVQKAEVIKAAAFVSVAVVSEEPEIEAPSLLMVALPNGLTVSGIDTSNIILAGQLIEVLR